MCTENSNEAVQIHAVAIDGHLVAAIDFDIAKRQQTSTSFKDD